MCRAVVPRRRITGYRHMSGQPHLRARRLVLHVARTRVGSRPTRECSARVSTGIRYEFAFGSYEDALQMVGVRSEPRFAGTAVSAARIQHFAAMVRDPNPAYWDEEFAKRVWGGFVAPPALLMGWLIPPPWLPTNRPPVPSIAIRVPLPGTTFVNASNEVEFFTPILEGDRLHVIEEVVSVSPEKETRLGVGHFIETCDEFHRADSTRLPPTGTRCSDSPPRRTHDVESTAGVGGHQRSD